jgi:sugar phosphate isomerase/epimerase
MKKLFLYGISSFLLTTLFVRCNDEPKETPKEETAAVATKNVTEDWKLGVQLWTFRMFSFVEAINKVDSAGIKFIEAYPGQKLGTEFKKEAFGSDMSAEARTKIKELLQSKGITLMAFGVIGGGTPDEWKKNFAFAKDMGIQYLTVEPTKTLWGLVDSLAGATGIKVAIHDHPKPSAYWHPDSVLAAMKGHPNIYACADIGHWARSGLDIVDCLKKLEGRILGAHLKDVNKFDSTKAEDVIPGTGVIKFPEVFAEFKRLGFTGMFSIERENNWDHNLPDVIKIKSFFEQEKNKLK